MDNKRIAFLLSGRGSKGPVGGYKVVYEYANRLVRDGYKVYILYPITLNFSKQCFMSKLRLIPRLFAWMISGCSCRKWFNLDERVKEQAVLSLNYKHVPQCDVYVATAVQTAYYLFNYPIDGKSKFYLIQDYEAWNVSENYVRNSYCFGFRNITISNWLSEKVKEVGASSTIIKNGFDFKYFKLYNPIENRFPRSISMLYHNDERKGCDIGLRSIRELKQMYPDLEVTFFGVPSRPEDLPKWIKYFQTPDRNAHNRIYNESAIYMAPSLQEGWGLTVGEAMICGAAIVCTDTLGFREMVENGKNGIIVPTSDSSALVRAIANLIEDNELRCDLARRGNYSIKSFDWGNSYMKFKSLVDA